MSELPRFVADVMLGSLAKWLRILGFDTLYFRDISDSELIRISRQQGRTLLTRDTGIAKRKGLEKHILISSNEVAGQLREVLGRMALTASAPPLMSRCAVCNGELARADKESVAGAVPEHVFLHHNSFFRCGSCGKVYWHGSHGKLIGERIEELLGETAWKSSENA